MYKYVCIILNSVLKDNLGLGSKETKGHTGERNGDTLGVTQGINPKNQKNWDERQKSSKNMHKCSIRTAPIFETYDILEDEKNISSSHLPFNTKQHVIKNHLTSIALAHMCWLIFDAPFLVPFVMGLQANPMWWRVREASCQKFRWCPEGVPSPESQSSDPKLTTPAPPSCRNFSPSYGAGPFNLKKPSHFLQEMIVFVFILQGWVWILAHIGNNEFVGSLKKEVSALSRVDTVVV